MRKLALFALALILIALPLSSLAQDAANEAAAWDDETEAWDSEAQTDGAAGEAETDARQVARDALPLTALIARALTLGALPFDGEPDATTAWALTYAALEQGAVTGMEDGQVSLDGLNEAYDALFAEGALPEMPEDFSLLTPDGDLYQQTSDPGDTGYVPYLLDASDADGAVSAEVAVMVTAPEVPEDLTALMSVALVPDEASPFGATLSGFFPITGAPAMTAADATATLEDYKDITYDAANVLDGDYTTCWAYPEEDEGAILTLSSDEPQTVRGIRLTPAYAKSEKIALANNRVKAFHVELSDGATFDFPVEPDVSGDDYECFAAFAFDGAHEVTWVSLTVTEVYPGGKYTDTCISEAALF